MSYLTTTNGNLGHKDHTFDMAGFGATLAKAVGGTFDPVKEEISLEDGLGLSLHWSSYKQPEKVRVQGTHVRLAEFGYNDRPTSLRFPDASMSFDRDVEALARDVNRRVIVPSREIAVRLVETIAKRDARTVAMNELVADLESRFPGLRISRGEEHSREAYLYLNEGTESTIPYFSGRVQGDGSVCIERIGSMSQKRFLKLMKALTCPLTEG